jgi:PAS domain S-box-containing protein
MSRMFGYAWEELSTIDAHRLYANPADREALLAMVRRGGAVHGYEVELRRHDGAVFHGSMTVTRADAEQDGILLSMWEDISERRRAQLALEDSETRFRDIVDYSYEPIGMQLLRAEPMLKQRKFNTLLDFERPDGETRLTSEPRSEIGGVWMPDGMGTFFSAETPGTLQIFYKDLRTGKVEITSQNHGFCVLPESLPENVEVTHVSLFDGTNEGLRCTDKPAFSVQYHPEASPGPRDSHYLFDRFVEMIGKSKGK